MLWQRRRPRRRRMAAYEWLPSLEDHDAVVRYVQVQLPAQPRVPSAVRMLVLPFDLIGPPRGIQELLVLAVGQVQRSERPLPRALTEVQHHEPLGSFAPGKSQHAVL